MTRQAPDDIAKLGPKSPGYGLDAVAVHLLQAPENAVRGLEHALESVPAKVFAPERLQLLADPAARLIDHRQLPFLAYRPGTAV
jgi:hypothetical protein